MAYGEVGTECNSGEREKRGRVALTMGGGEIKMVPFVENLLYNVVVAVLKELDGYSPDGEIELRIRAAE
ncbi:MAG: hypothetical protein LBS85_02850 [Clostridiales Family XIII bacterium]|jgi:hypothetical protein|nr:hypothetical protein [Clostridiales Family XIII bacterium]